MREAGIYRTAAKRRLFGHNKVRRAAAASSTPRFLPIQPAVIYLPMLAVQTMIDSRAPRGTLQAKARHEVGRVGQEKVIRGECQAEMKVAEVRGPREGGVFCRRACLSSPVPVRPPVLPSSPISSPSPSLLFSFPLSSHMLWKHGCRKEGPPDSKGVFPKMVMRKKFFPSEYENIIYLKKTHYT